MQAVCGAPPSSGTGQRLRLPQRHGTVAAAAAPHLEVLKGGQQGVFCICHQQARVGAQQGGPRPRLHVDNMQASQLGPPAAAAAEAAAAAAGVQGRVEGIRKGDDTFRLLAVCQSNTTGAGCMAQAAIQPNHPSASRGSSSSSRWRWPLCLQRLMRTLASAHPAAAPMGSSSPAPQKPWTQCPAEQAQRGHSRAEQRA